jgi:uncharacterized paraquat-inducible protein A
MRATYCPQCDETRWQLTGLPVQRATTCSSCGTELETERRQPGRRRVAEALVERRTASAEPPARPA